MRIFLPIAIGALLLTAVLGSVAYADQVYHSERLDLTLTGDGATAGHPDLLSGQVINVHPNGPVNGALERYSIVGAKPNTSYDVMLAAYIGGCSGAPVLALTTAVLNTNDRGVAHAAASFSADDLAPFSGATVQVQWTLVASGVQAYQTTCTTVTID